MSSNFYRLVQHGLCATVFFMAALFCSLLIFGFSPENDYRVMSAAVPVSAAFVGLISWAAFTSLGSSVKIWKGVLTGILAGSISHYLTWYTTITGAYLEKTVSSLGEPTFNPLEGIWASFIFTVFSLAFVGWITIPLGAIIGGALAAFTKKFLDQPLENHFF